MCWCSCANTEIISVCFHILSSIHPSIHPSIWSVDQADCFIKTLRALCHWCNQMKCRLKSYWKKKKKKKKLGPPQISWWGNDLGFPKPPCMCIIMYDETSLLQVRALHCDVIFRSSWHQCRRRQGGAFRFVDAWIQVSRSCSSQTGGVLCSIPAILQPWNHMDFQCFLHLMIYYYFFSRLMALKRMGIVDNYEVSQLFLINHTNSKQCKCKVSLWYSLSTYM